MAKKKKKQSSSPSNSKPAWHEALDQETKHSLWAIFSFCVGVILTLAYFGKAGAVGNGLQHFLAAMLGKAFFVMPMVCFVAGIAFLRSSARRVVGTTLIGGLLFLIGSLGLFDVILGRYEGGYAGFVVAYPLLKAFDYWPSVIILGAAVVASLLIMLNVSLRWKKREDADESEQKNEVGENLVIQQPLASTKPSADNRSNASPVDDDEDDFGADAELSDEKKVQVSFFGKKSAHPKPMQLPTAIAYTPPPLDFLEDNKGTPSSGDIKANANIIKRTLGTFGIDVEMAEVHVGPSVTQYTLKPAEGIKLSRITALHNDLALALAAHPLRIEAPIPGKSLVGIEVPNRSIALVGLRSILELEDYQKAPPLTISVGRDVTGSAVFSDIAKMPHMLVAGATGSGKSIAIHTLIVSLLYKNSPEMLRFIMVDPKRVELSIYNKIPHLLTPVIIEAKKAVMALRWAVREMERRYEKLSEIGARDVNSFNTAMLKDGNHAEVLPLIVIIVDELADLMGTYPREIEGAIVRLAQMSRAVGIHLVVSTQRPSVEVITGLIKANITARMALQVASGIDSRTILDMSGAEKLLGNGDMLYLAGDTSKPRRIQGAFISEREVKHIVAHLAKAAEDMPDTKIQFESPTSAIEDPLNSVDEGGVDDDDLYEEAKKIVIEAQKASTSYLQRRLRVGYARAARLIDILEERGVVGPGEGAKARDVLIKKNKSDDMAYTAPEENSIKDLTQIKSTTLKEDDTPYTNFDDELK